MHSSTKPSSVAAQPQRTTFLELAVVGAVATMVVSGLVFTWDTALATREAHATTVISHGFVDHRGGRSHHIVAQAGERQVKISVPRTVQDELPVGSVVPVEVEIGGLTGRIRSLLQRPQG